MPVIRCAWCGTLFPGRNNAKYCNTDCYHMARAFGGSTAARPEPDVCRFTEGVDCSQQTMCDQCGWNPEVAEKRLVRILAQMFDVEVKTDGI